MTREREIEVLQNLDKRTTGVMISKGADYATEDVLSNFKRLSAAAGALGLDVNTSSGYALFMVLLKIDRINNLTSNGKTPNNESVDDSFMDGINYLKLAYCCYLDSQDNKED